MPNPKKLYIVNTVKENRVAPEHQWKHVMIHAHCFSSSYRLAWFYIMKVLTVLEVLIAQPCFTLWKFSTPNECLRQSELGDEG